MTAEDDETGEEILLDHPALYPPRLPARPSLDHDYLLPPSVARIYRETHRALSFEQPVLSGVGIRALIEAVCRNKNTPGTTLVQRIDSLVAIGVLTVEGAAILHSLRIMGNEAAHRVKPHALRDLLLAFDVAEHLLKGVYILPGLAPQLPGGA